MTIRNLQYLFRPQSVAVIGASDRPHSVGRTVMLNLRESGFAGPVWPVNPKHAEVAGRPAYASVADLPEAPDLAIICTPAATVPSLIGELGGRGTRAAVVLTAGLNAVSDAAGTTLTATMLEAARPHLLRILGPNCIGLLSPGNRLNASFAHTQALPGSIAFVSQSGALTTALLDWARSQEFGFSHFVSLGESADVDFGDVIDYLGSDPQTRAILLYIESITAARKFMSAARAAARNKPVIAVKAGRTPESAKAAASHTGALAGQDEIYDAALRRAGILRVATTRELFSAAETLARVKSLITGDRLAILTNGGGPGVMAADALIAGGGHLAVLAPETVERLNGLLPATWSHANPVDIIGDAPTERYQAALQVLFADPGYDAILFMHAPTAIVASTDIARCCAPLAAAAGRPVLACWLGGPAVREANSVFSAAGIPTFDTPEEAVRGFLQLVQYRRNRELLMQTPSSAMEDYSPDTAAARNLIHQALAQDRALLTEPEAKGVLAAYGVPVVQTRIVRDAEEAVSVATGLGFPVVLKILSPDITHKSDVGGVALDLPDAASVRAAAQAMIDRCARAKPGARLEGFTVQPMIRRSGAHELIAGLTTDPVFGPVILFGQGGTAAEVVADTAMALPPLNLVLAQELVGRTRVARLLAGYRERPPADALAIQLTLVKLAQLAADLPEIAELDINPLLADAEGVIALDARIKVVAPGTGGTDRFVIRPYPKELEEWIEFEGRKVLLRPIRPEDEPQHRELLSRVEPSDMHLRFLHMVRELPHSELARYTQIDYD
ncbi:MAG: acetate--CoA ligase family protein, partial [Burkholderiales bacterium]